MEKLRYVVDHTHILGVENVRPPRVLLYGKELTGALLLHEGILVPTGLGAGAPGGVPARHIIGEDTPAGITHAHRPVNESLYLQTRGPFGTYLRHLVQSQLPGQDHSLRPLVVPKPGGGIVGDAGLGGDVDAYLWSIALGQSQHTHIPYNEGVCARIL